MPEGECVETGMNSKKEKPEDIENWYIDILLLFSHLKKIVFHCLSWGEGANSTKKQAFKNVFADNISILILK